MTTAAASVRGSGGDAEVALHSPGHPHPALYISAVVRPTTTKHAHKGASHCIWSGPESALEGPYTLSRAQAQDLLVNVCDERRGEGSG